MVYKEDFLKIIETLDPENSRSDVYKTALNQFFDHHIKMMTTLTDRYRLLYADLAVNAIALAAQPVAGAVAPLLPTQVVDSVKTATLGTTGAGEVLGATASKTTKVAARDLPTLSTANPIIQVPRPETQSEKLLRYTNKDKQKKLALAGATFIAGLAFGPVGAAVVGIGGGTVLYAQKFYDANEDLNDKKKTTRETKDTHEEEYCKFCENLLKDHSLDMDERKITEIDKRLESRRKKVASTHSSMDSSTPSQSTNDIFVQLHEANPEFDPSKLTEFDPSEVLPRLSQDEEFKPTIPKLETERTATTTVTTEPTSTSSAKETKHNSDEDNTQTPVEVHAPKSPI